MVNRESAGAIREVSVVNEPFKAALTPALEAAARPEKAAGMQAYMKSAMPYLGVPVPIVRKIVTSVARQFPFHSGADFDSGADFHSGADSDADTEPTVQLRRTAEVLWRTAEFREQRYAAMTLTGLKPAKAQLSLLPLYEEMISTGAWWDHVDEVAHRSCDLLQAHRSVMEPVIRRWSTSDDFWFRRSAIIAQLGAKSATDPVLLLDVIIANMADKEFFVRKAIGWALRDYAKSNPVWVREFVRAHEKNLSPLSRLEALKNIG